MQQQKRDYAWLLGLGFIFLLSSFSGTVLAKDSKSTKTNQKQKKEVVEMSGISIIGNRELPKTLFIVPWKNTEVGYETRLTNTLDEGMKPVDKAEFVRELDYYEFMHSATK